MKGWGWTAGKGDEGGGASFLPAPLLHTTLTPHPNTVYRPPSSSPSPPPKNLKQEIHTHTIRIKNNKQQKASPEAIHAPHEDTGRPGKYKSNNAILRFATNLTIKQRHGTAHLAPKGREEGKVEVVGEDAGINVFGGKERVREEKEAVRGIRGGHGA